ncbi:hypothetical protein NUZ5A_50265 [Candidatus Nitrosotenuis uzonensis]|uniref:Uncharacterized protein n=1 Tax=Candidatus Nitrosotenuis uzonensis TaxID=1407055 RepID=A0A812F6I7_9ARCH|nr:hypothetical protein NUZ5A_50265 [Candidatus Nitrosotenuis uzonensis]
MCQHRDKFFLFYTKHIETSHDSISTEYNMLIRLTFLSFEHVSFFDAFEIRVTGKYSCIR